VIRVRTWCRADFAGGTLDIWPLGLLHPGARTVNVALDLAVEVRLSPRRRGFVVLQDGERLEVDNLAELATLPGGALVSAVAFAESQPPFSVEIESASPRGAGLGASSALTVALLAAAEVQLHGALTRSAAVRAAVARDIEARLMGLPTGLQDHYPAQLGGVLELAHAPGGEQVTALEVDLASLGDHLLVGFTGQSHFSAGANWLVVRRRLEADPFIVDRLGEIAAAANRLPEALTSGDWARAGEWVGREWTARRQLSAEISTPAIESLLASARDLGAWGGKACGAGGGGSVLALVPAGQRAAIADAWRAQGAQILPARPTASGLEVEADSAS
jgi:D-glycero-alpha-D-manno-heptose-7-phosphate kinase